MSSAPFPVTERNRVERLPKRASYQRDDVYAILDEGMVCHVGFVQEGQPFVIPCFYARDDDRLLLHGGVGSRMLQALASGAECCITVTLLDGLVLARSAFHHSMNFRSVVCFGRPERITEPEAKRHALACLVDKLVVGRNADVRGPNASELKATEVVALPLTEASAKVRSGPPVDDARDRELDVWAGEVPMKQQRQAPVPASDLRPDIALPDYLLER